MELTKVQEEYLKTIYLLQDESGKARVTDIAKKLNKTKATVNYNVANLKDVGLLNHETYGSVHLTNEGASCARKVLEAYDIVHLFLSEILGLDEDAAEVNATRIKATIDDETLNKLAKYTHKTLGLHSLDCGYDINNERCISCAKRNLAKRKEESK